MPLYLYKSYYKNAKFKNNASALFLGADFLFYRDRNLEQRGQYQKSHGPDA
jgi:hypothetical protein